MTTPIKVEQVDREAAWPLVPSNSIAGQDREGFFAGRYDDCAAIQSHARHRFAAEAKTREEDARIADEAERQQEIDHGAANTGGAAQAATAIRSRMETDNGR